jgi:hypothetical protein
MQPRRKRKRQHRCFGDVLYCGDRCRTGESRGPCGRQRLADHARGLMAAVSGNLLGGIVRGMSREFEARADWRRVGVDVGLDDEGLEEDGQKRRKAERQAAPSWR